MIMGHGISSTMKSKALFVPQAQKSLNYKSK